MLEDDALLFSLGDLADGQVNGTAVDEVEELREQLANLQAQFNAYRAEVQKSLITKLEDVDAPKEGNTRATNIHGAAEQDATQTLEEQVDSGYFESYSYNSIHEIMLKDTVRTDAYRDFIYENKELFQNKVVLDVGCGTGILSMFCAKAGAKTVYAVDNSGIIEKARQNVAQNGLQDIVKCIRGKIEEVALPTDKVDIIVSEWMGYCLLYESMLDSVIYARDKYLVPGGLMVPSHATLQIAPLADSEIQVSHVGFWQDVYGFDMTHMLEKAHREVLARPVDAEEIAADSATFLQLDLRTAAKKDLTFEKGYKFEWKEGHKLLEGLVIWFDIFFLASSEASLATSMTVPLAKKEGIVAFSTGPATKQTHWQQGVFLIEDSNVAPLAGEMVLGTVTYRKREELDRSLEITISWKTEKEHDLHAQTWDLE